jgi:hypothetical protein
MRRFGARWRRDHPAEDAPREGGAGTPASYSEPAESRGPERGGEPAVGGGEPAVGRGERVSRRRGFSWRTRETGAAAVGVLGSGVLLLARLVMAVAALIALLIGLAIVLRDVDANTGNTIVKGIHEGANFFAGAFTGLLTFSGHPKREITVDWGIALVAYLVVGALIAGFIARLGRSGVLFGRSHRAAPSH